MFLTSVTPYILGATNVDLFTKIRFPYLVQIRLSTASPKWVASSGSTVFLRSELLSFSNFPFLNF